MVTDERLPHRARRLRRPSGEPPPLPHPPGWSRWIWLCAAVVVIGFVLAAMAPTGGPFSLEDEILEWAASLRSPTLNDVAKAINVLTYSGVILAIRLAVVLVLAIFKRWRHLWCPWGRSP
jgi:hypothetical protein